MGLIKYKLGELIYEITRKNSSQTLGVDFVRGISNTKEIMPTKANTNESVVKKFYIINPNEFIYNPRTTRMGEKVGLAYNNTNGPLLFSFNNIAFGLKESAKKILLPDYLYMYFNRNEFDRYARINSWGTATELFSFNEMCDIEIDLPPLIIQQKYVDIYNAMLSNQFSYEQGLDDLKLTCDAYIEDLRNKFPSTELRHYISEVNERNVDLQIQNVQGVNSNSQFDKSKANLMGVDLSKYKIVQSGQFAYNPSRINLGSISLLNSDKCIVSPMYTVFKVVDENILLPQYLMIWFGREEFHRSTFFYATGSVRDTFSFDIMQEVEIPIPDISIQKDIVNIYNSYIMRKDLNGRLKRQLKNICPILIKGSIEETER